MHHHVVMVNKSLGAKSHPEFFNIMMENIKMISIKVGDQIYSDQIVY